MIEQAAIYRIESLFGNKNLFGIEMGGMIDHNYSADSRIYGLNFTDNFTGNFVKLQNLPSADLITKEVIEEKDRTAYNASYYLGSYIRGEYKLGDPIQQATLLLMGL